MGFAVQEILVVVVSESEAQASFEDRLVEPRHLLLTRCQSEPTLVKPRVHNIQAFDNNLPVLIFTEGINSLEMVPIDLENRKEIR